MLCYVCVGKAQNPSLRFQFAGEICLPLHNKKLRCLDVKNISGLSAAIML